ncbi:hypothetical protein ACP275_04G221000 [Erythranthe tilingii]
MGVPSFFWWLIDKYPNILSGNLEERRASLLNHEVELFDNFYLDMNRIIYDSCPSDNDPYGLLGVKTFDEIFSCVCEHIDRLFDIVKPKKLLFLAIDGVAPRAKSTRMRLELFRTEKFDQIKKKINGKLREQFEEKGKALLPKIESEVDGIAPGTEFMHILSKKLRSYITLRMSDNPAWQNIKVILSDEKVPGEGEHKIMSFIRAQRSSPGYNPNTTHCVYGTDADLIVLALATHEIHFSILREEPISKDDRTNVCQFLNIRILREYLALDLEVSIPGKCEYDAERVIDDFIFISFFLGNDFLPRMPTFGTNEGCLDLLIHVYKKEFQRFGGYLVDMQKAEDKFGGYVDFERIERFMLTVGEYEDKIFVKRSKLRERKLKQTYDLYRNANDWEDYDEVNKDAILSSSDSAVGDHEVLKNTLKLRRKLNAYILCNFDLFSDGVGVDKVKFGTSGWRERYYKEKFSAQSPDEIEATRKSLVASYCEGLCWLLLCYFSGVPSWSWFYPHYYCPFASDFKELSQTKVEFRKGVPFKPFDQFMGVITPWSSPKALPIAYKELTIDKNSKIIDFYPTKFEIDHDGQRYPWRGISKIPFIEEERLLTETRKLENELNEDEKIRNLQSLELLFVKRTNEINEQILFGGDSAAPAQSDKIEDAIMIDSTIDGVKGNLHLLRERLTEPDNDNNGEYYSENILCIFYEVYEGLHHLPRLLEGVNIPRKRVARQFVEPNLWHSYGFQKWESSSQIRRMAKEETSLSWRPNYGTKGYNQQCEHNQRSIERPSSSRRDDYGGTGKSSNKNRQADSKFWSSRNGSSTHNPSDDDWRLNKTSRADRDASWRKTT